MTDISSLMRALPERANAIPSLVRSGRYCTTELMLEADAAQFHLTVERGRVIEVVEGPLRMRAWRFAVRAPLAAWMAFWQPVPAVGFNDIFAMVRYGHARIEGDVGPLLEHLRYVKALLALPRVLLAERAP